MRSAWLTIENSPVAKIRAFTTGNGNAERLLPEDLIRDFGMDGVEFFRLACDPGQIGRAQLDVFVFNLQFSRRKAGVFHVDGGFALIDSAVFHRKQHFGLLLSRFQVQIDADHRHPPVLNANKRDFLLLPVDFDGFHSGLIGERQLDDASLVCRERG